MKNQSNCNAYNLGLIAEKRALNVMISLGFTMLKSRYKSKLGEIDLIVINESKKLIVFLEVKYRKKIYDYDCVLSQKQIERIKNSSEEFMLNNDKFKDFDMRIDVFIFTPQKYIHIENITM